MKLSSDLGRRAPKKLRLTLIAAAAVAFGMPFFAFADTEGAPNPGTQSALACLLHTGPNGCEQIFAASASRPATRWVHRAPWPDFALGAVESTAYARTITDADAYDTRLLNGRPADVYDVKFAHQEMTFYLSLPEPDGKIRYLSARDGTPDDEKSYLRALGPG